MDIDYMQSSFHQTHYRFFYMTLPSMLRSEIFSEVLNAINEGTGNQFLVGFWRATARQVYQLPMGTPLPREIDLTRNDFSAHAMSPQRGMTFLLLTGPAPRGPVEAGCAVAVLEDARPIETLRYFTCEAPMEPEFPWMVGEWFADGGRANLGGISDISAQGMYNFVAQRLGINAPAPVDRTTQLLGSTGRAMNQIGFTTDWSSSPAQLAQDASSNLERLLTTGGKALVMSTKKTKGLAKKTASYVQFMWNEDGSLIVEIQADYSYWRVGVPESHFAYIRENGLSIPSSQSENFALLIPSGVTPEHRTATLEKVFQVFVNVIQPTGKILESHF
jgi:hypothetical protein